MMPRIPFGSPAKENLPASPCKKRKIDPLIQLINYLKTTSINLPPHIAKLLSSNPESPLKQVNTQQHQEQDKKLKVKLSQCEFQLKKIQEDFAEYKRQVKIQKEKEAKKNQEQILKLKVSIQNGVEDSAYKLHKSQQKFEEEIRALKQKHHLELEQQTNKIKIALQHKIEAQQKLRKRQTTEIQRNSDRKLSQVTKNHEQVISALQKRFQDEIQQLKMRHKSLIQDKQRRHESIRVALESQRRTEQKLHEKTKLQSSKQRQKLICELCFQKNMRSQLEQDVQLKEKQIRKLKNEIKDKEVDIQLNEQRAERRLEEAKSQYQKKISSAEKQYGELAKNLLKAQYQQLSSMQTKIKELQIQHQKQIELLALNSDEIANNFQLRPSKPQDLSEIEKLKWALAKKDDEARKLKNDLKHCNLELENKEQIYTRIFRGNSMSREKRNPFKQDREQAIIEQKLGRETVFRKSQTTDVKYLLKIYNNTKNS